MLWLTAVSTLPFLFLLHGEYLFDDIQVIESNAALKAVASFWDCFTFVLKPSKPVTNFWLAIGQWLGGGAPFMQRLLSVLFHLGAVWLVYLNLVFLRLRAGQVLPSRFPFWVALLFAVAPIHTETLGVGLFRMEILGTFFTLTACLALQVLFTRQLSKGRKFAWFTVLFLSMGLGPLSKEVFLLVLPAALLAVAWVPGDRKLTWKVPVALGMVQGFWAMLLLVLLRRDPQSDFPYQDVVGFGHLDGVTQVRLAASALLELLYKILTGHGLTILRLRDRNGVGQHLGQEGAALVLVAAALVIVWLYRRGGLTRLFALWTGVGLGVYLVIPNINIGSEHYAYFPSIGVFALVVLGLWRLLAHSSRRSQSVTGLLVVAYAVALGLGLGARLRHMDSRLAFYLSEAEKHPENAGVWTDVAMAFMEKRPSHAEEARPFLERAKRLNPDHPNTHTAEFLMNFHAGNVSEAERLLKDIERVFSSKPKYVGSFYFHVGLLKERAGLKGEAARAYLKAIEKEPGKLLYAEAYRRTLNPDENVETPTSP